jgi:hypothetical protein
VAVLLVSLTQTGAAASLLTTVGLTSAQQPLLELYFDAPGQHPVDVKAGQRVPVVFDLRSRSGSVEDVQWTLETQQGSTVQRQATGTVNVPDGQVVSVRRSATISCSPGATDPRTQVRVTTSDPARTILFWVTCPAGKP